MVLKTHDIRHDMRYLNDFIILQLLQMTFKITQLTYPLHNYGLKLDTQPAYSLTNMNLQIFLKNF